MQVGKVADLLDIRRPLHSSNPNGRVTSGISRLFVFDPRLGPREGEEHLKEIYYWPTDEDASRRQSDIGLSEALVNFTQQFSRDQPCDLVHLGRVKEAFLNLEEEYWMVMHVEIPQVRDERSPHSISDEQLKVAIRVLYRLFKLFNGTPSSIVKRESVDAMKARFAQFMNAVIPTLQTLQLDLLSSIDTVLFLPLDRNVYLKTLCFSHYLETAFPAVFHASFLFKDHLVWSGLDLEDMKILYYYLVNFLCADAASAPAWGGVQGGGAGGSSRSKSSAHLPTFSEPPQGIPLCFRPRNRRLKGEMAGFMTPVPQSGPASSSAQETGQVPVGGEVEFEPLYVYLGEQSQRYQMVVYRLHDMTCLLLVDDRKGGGGSTALTPRFYHSIARMLSGQISSVIASIAEIHDKKMHYEEPMKYLYLNSMNSAIKSSIRRSTAFTDEDVVHLNGMHAELAAVSEGIGELVVQSSDERWIAARRSEHREIYLVYDQKGANLLILGEILDRLLRVYFRAIFIE